MVEEEKIKKIAKFRSIIEKRVKETETELEGLRALLEFADAVLLEEGFKRAEIPRPPPPTAPEIIQPPVPSPPAIKGERIIPIKMVTGELLANLYVQEDNLRVVPAEERDFNVNIPPFMSFLVERVLEPMKEKNNEAVKEGEIPPDKMFSYDIVRDGDIIREITIRNVTPDRSQSLKSAIRWTLEKMYEKMTQPSS